MSEHTSFLTIFPGCEDLSAMAGGLDKAYVTDVQVDPLERTMTVCAWFPAMPSPVDISALGERLKLEYGLSGVGLVPAYPQPKAASSALAGAAKPPSGGAPQGDVLFGRAIKMHPVPGVGQGLRGGGRGGGHQPYPGQAGQRRPGF